MSREKNKVKLLKWGGQISSLSYYIDCNISSPPSWWNNIPAKQAIHIVLVEKKALQRMKKLYNKLLIELKF